MKYSSTLLAAIAFTGVWAIPAPMPAVSGDALAPVTGRAVQASGNDLTKAVTDPAGNLDSMHSAKRQTAANPAPVLSQLSPQQLSALLTALGLPSTTSLAQVETLLTGLLTAVGLSINLLLNLTVQQIGQVIAEILAALQIPQLGGVQSLLSLTVGQIVTQFTPAGAAAQPGLLAVIDSILNPSATQAA
ncbi:hypothetical protein MMYC01_206289 [Madurella mycetomatis]|uniref:Uncharacterized protein n=1 Tax=Madurella mycetomatis TaxID=100816 RepID=A0A175W640_9PEZI|nr:hypothetical protein MMYC01_206289 [Madurella mycetomatis]